MPFLLDLLAFFGYAARMPLFSRIRSLVKILALAFSLITSLPAAGKTQYFVHVSFNSTLQLINEWHFE